MGVRRVKLQPSRTANRFVSPEDFWNQKLSKDEKLSIEAAFLPMGNISAEAMVKSGSVGSLGSLLGHLKKEAIRNLGYRLIYFTDTLISEDTRVLDLHFYWGSRGDFFYRWRNHDEFALEEAIKSYRNQIGLAPNALMAFKQDETLGFIPAHGGYRQLRIIEEKRANFTLAMALCEKAKEQGWRDNWDKHIARLGKKLAKETG